MVSFSFLCYNYIPTLAEKIKLKRENRKETKRKEEKREESRKGGEGKKKGRVGT